MFDGDWREGYMHKQAMPPAVRRKTIRAATVPSWSASATPLKPAADKLVTRRGSTPALLGKAAQIHEVKLLAFRSLS